MQTQKLIKHTYLKKIDSISQKITSKKLIKHKSPNQSYPKIEIKIYEKITSKKLIKHQTSIEQHCWGNKSAKRA